MIVKATISTMSTIQGQESSKAEMASITWDI